MFLELVPEDVSGKLAELSCANVERGCRRRKHKNGPKTMQLREYALREFLEIFVDDRPFCRDAFFKHANVQSKAVF